MKSDAGFYWIGLVFAALLATGGCAHQKEGSAANQAGGDKQAEAAATTPQAASQTPQVQPSPAPKAPAAPTPTTPDQVKTTPSGLKYVDLVVGTGPSPRVGQTVIVQYTGWLTDGKKFDSSLDRGKPLTFPLGQRRVIAGWDEGIATMKVGGKRQLLIPAKLGYGARGFPGAIPPDADLIFEVELLGIR